jgi:hypothetical protein
VSWTAWALSSQTLPLPLRGRRSRVPAAAALVAPRLRLYWLRTARPPAHPPVLAHVNVVHQRQVQTKQPPAVGQPHSKVRLLLQAGRQAGRQVWWQSVDIWWQERLRFATVGR